MSAYSSLREKWCLHAEVQHSYLSHSSLKKKNKLNEQGTAIL